MNLVLRVDTLHAVRVHHVEDPQWGFRRCAPSSVPSAPDTYSQTGNSMSIWWMWFFNEAKLAASSST